MIRDAVIFIILYYDIFQYPLKEEDIASLLVHKYTPNLIQATLRELHQQGLIHEFDSYYSTRADMASLVAQRKISNERALVLLKKVPSYAGLLSAVPFVKSIAVSGSLSKGSANANADIDFIVITKHNRLWICKSMVQGLKRILRLLGKEHFLCANYFIAESKTGIDEKNIFIAIELATLIPVYKPAHFDQFLLTNQWSQQLVANNRNQEAVTPYAANKVYFLKGCKYLTSALLFPFAFFLDNMLLSFSRKRWKKAHAHRFKDEAEFDRSIKIRKNEVKYHLNSFQHNVVAQFEKKLSQYTADTGITFSAESLAVLKFGERP